MDAMRRANFASRQIRAGPAPLASFEDLPSDELESPEDFTQLPMLTSSALDDESSSQDLQFTTPDSLTISSQSTPRIECDFDSHFTLTPADSYEGKSTAEMRTTSLSSLSKAAIPSMEWPKETSTLNVSQKKGGSAQSLGSCDDSSKQTDSNARKTSWTDIFRSHNQNSAKISEPISPTSDAPAKETKHTKKKKSRSDLTKKEDAKSKEKGKFLSMFKKRSNKNTTPLSPPGDSIVPSENVNVTESIQNVPEEVVQTKFTNGSCSKGKENELPKDIELCSTISEGQNDLGKVNTEKSEKIPDERKISRKLINISENSFEKEYNILTRQDDEKQLDKVSKSENIQAIVDEAERESSESETVLDTTKEESVDEEKKEEDYEAENLISLDMSELDEDSVAEIHPMVMDTPKQTVIPSRQQRLEVTTKPIDRPRSTTPINVAPLEAFIKSVSPTFVAKVEKIKLSLPGEQFLGRVKSPKKSSARSWTAFCESGLHSPRMHKRLDSEEQADPFSDGAYFQSDAQLSSDSDSLWAAFESNLESSDSYGFCDSFANGGGSDAKEDEQLSNFFGNGSSNGKAMDNKFGDPYQSFEANFSVMSCSCSCHAYGCASCAKSQLKGEVQAEGSFEFQDCTCVCHRQSKVLSEVDKRTFMSEGLKSCDSSNLFDSLSHQQL